MMEWQYMAALGTYFQPEADIEAGCFEDKSSTLPKRYRTFTPSL